MANPNSAVFPDSVATDSILMVASNRALSTLTTAIDSMQTSIVVTNGTIFQYPCLVQIDGEIIFVLTVSGNTLQTCTRGFASTTATVHSQNANVNGYVLSYHHNQIAAEVKAIESALGANMANVLTPSSSPGGGHITGTWSDLTIGASGVTPGTYGGPGNSLQIIVDAAGQVTSATSAPLNNAYPVFYKAGIVQGGSAVLGFSTGMTNAPTPSIVDNTGSNGSIYVVALFAQGNWVQDHFFMPADWSEDAVSMEIYWRSSAITGNVTWQCQLGSVRSGSNPNLVFNSAGTVTTTAQGTTENINLSTITTIPTGSIQPGDEVFFKLARSGSDSLSGNAELLSIKINIDRQV